MPTTHTHMGSSDSGPLPILGTSTLFSAWQSDAKAYLRRKEVWGCCTANTTVLKAKLDIGAIDKCAGILWGLLSPEVKVLVKKHEDDPAAMWTALEEIFAPRK